MGTAAGPGEATTDRDRGPLEAVIFDLDGVLTDTAEYHYLGWKRLADEMGWDFDRAKNEQLRGVSRMDSLDLILGGRPVPAEEKAALAARKNAYYVESLEQVTPADLLPGARELLAACQAAGLRIAVGSSSRNARTVLARLGITHLFEAISDGDAVARAKPAPDLFLHAADELGVAPDRCAVVEDAESGVAAALAAGMLAVGIGPPERIGAAHLRYPTVGDVRLEDILTAARERTT
jgi:beta-phosphoglucomutase